MIANEERYTITTTAGHTVTVAISRPFPGRIDVTATDDAGDAIREQRIAEKVAAKLRAEEEPGEGRVWRVRGMAK